MCHRGWRLSPFAGHQIHVPSLIMNPKVSFINRDTNFFYMKVLHKKVVLDRPKPSKNRSTSFEKFKKFKKNFILNYKIHICRVHLLIIWDWGHQSQSSAIVHMGGTLGAIQKVCQWPRGRWVKKIVWQGKGGSSPRVNVAFHVDNNVWVENMHILANMRSKICIKGRLIISSKFVTIWLVTRGEGG